MSPDARHPRHSRRQIRKLAFWLAALTTSASPASAQLDNAANGADTPALFAADIDCVNAFDLFASFAMLHCAFADAEGNSAGSDDRRRIARAFDRLEALGRVPPEARKSVNVRLCPLVNGTGLVPAPGTILLDDSLRGMSDALFTEILAHEWVHVAQFERLGTTGFKCEYVRQMTRCGGCQDAHHPLEQEAYDAQADVARLLEGAASSQSGGSTP